MDKRYMEFGRAFENEFVTQQMSEDRDIDHTLDLGWVLLGILPREELDRIPGEMLDRYYNPYEESRGGLRTWI